jgi:enoyl-[acyl-carrier protein] reductase I
VRSLLLTARHALPLLRRSDAPRIVALFSAGGELAIPNYHLVGIVKGALASTLRYLAQDLGPLGVLCNGVSFPMVETEAAESVLGKEVVAQTRAYLGKRSMTRTPASFGNVTNAVGFLTSASCQNLTGEIINVDGGFCRNYF